MSCFTATRDIAARPEAVFAAFADESRLARWWGPRGFSNRISLCEFRPGGRWLLTMIGPDGHPYPNESRFAAIEPPQRIVIEHLSAPEFSLTVTLTPSAGGTRVQWQQQFADAALAAMLRERVEPANAQNLERLEAEVLGRDPA